MAKLLTAFALTMLIVLALNFLSCGGGETPRQLLSVTVTPQTATASDFPVEWFSSQLPAPSTERLHRQL
jgi:hypothetical protein